jgi:hypothetical protein
MNQAYFVDVGQAELTVEQINFCLGQPGTVSSLIAPSFDSYVRVLHPAYRENDMARAAVTWAEIARCNQTVLHPLCQFPNVSGVMDPEEGPSNLEVWSEPPEQGTLPADIAARLTSHLKGADSTPDMCWFSIWTGWSDVDLDIPREARLDLRTRELAVLRGPIGLARESISAFRFQSPYSWWSPEGQWCVTTDIDLSSTYVGGTAAIAEALFQDDQLEVLPASPWDPIGLDGDRINPPPEL